MKAFLVRLRLEQIISSTLEEREISLESMDTVILAVEAATAQKGPDFHQPGFSEFTMVDGAAAALFSHFATNNKK